MGKMGMWGRRGGKAAVLAAGALAAGAAWGWGGGHDTVARCLARRLPAALASALDDPATRRDCLAWAHFPDGRIETLERAFPADAAWMKARGVTTAYAFHHDRARCLAVDRLVDAVRAGDVRRQLFWINALGHAIADLAACNHDPLVHVLEYGWRNLGVFPNAPLDFCWVEGEGYAAEALGGAWTREILARRLRELPDPAVPDGLTPDALGVDLCFYAAESSEMFRHSLDIARGAALWSLRRDEAAGRLLAERLCDLGLWGVSRTLFVYAAARRFAADPDYREMDYAAVARAAREKTLAYEAARPTAADAMTAGLLPDGAASRIRVLYDSQGRFGRGTLDVAERFLAVPTAASLRRLAPAARATLLDTRDLAWQGLDPRDADLLVVYGRVLGDWGAVKGRDLRARIGAFAAAGGRVLWIDGTPDALPGWPEIGRARRTSTEKEGYCRPAFPFSYLMLTNGCALAWTGTAARGVWPYRRTPSAAAGWVWKGSPFFFEAAEVPAGAKPVLELRSPEKTVVYGVAWPAQTPRFAYLPTTAFFPYVLTDERPMLDPFTLRLDACGEAVLGETLRLLGVAERFNALPGAAVTGIPYLTKRADVG